MALCAADFAKSLGLLEQARALESYVLQRGPLCAYCQWRHLFTLQLQYLLPPFDSLRETPQWDRLLERIGRSPELIREIDFEVTRFVDLQSQEALYRSPRPC